jgi:hypothetical protein
VSPLDADDLVTVIGGGFAGTNPFERMYSGAVAFVKGAIGGGMLAKTMYGADATAAERSNGRQYLTSYLRGDLDPSESSSVLPR